MRTVDALTMRRIDREAQERYGIPEILLMESAGREAAQVAQERLKSRKGTVAFFCGRGNNGGDGFVMARYLLLREMPVVLFLLSEKDRLKGSARVNFEILLRWGCPLYEIRDQNDLAERILKGGPLALGVDALLGIGLNGEVEDPYRFAIEEINRLSCPVLAVDIPSGLCATTGRILGCSVQAEQTVTFGLPKKGFYLGEGPSVTGEVIVKNIGYPNVLLS